MADDMDDVPETVEEDGTLRAAADKIAALMAEDDKTSSRAGAEDGEAAEAPAAQEPQPQAPAQPEAMAQAAAVAQAAIAERDRLAVALHTLGPQMQAAALRQEFADLQTVDDLQRLAQNDPGRYNRYVFAQMKVQQAQQAGHMVQAQQQQVAAMQRAAWEQGELAKLNAAIPEITQGKEGALLARRLHAFAVKSGYTPRELAQAGAKDYVVLHRAMRLAEIEAAQGAARDKARMAPAVQRPGTHSAGAGGTFRSDLERLQKTGRVDDAAAVFRNLLSR